MLAMEEAFKRLKKSTKWLKAYSSSSHLSLREEYSMKLGSGGLPDHGSKKILDNTGIPNWEQVV